MTICCLIRILRDSWRQFRPFFFVSKLANWSWVNGRRGQGGQYSHSLVRYLDMNESIELPRVRALAPLAGQALEVAEERLRDYLDGRISLYQSRDEAIAHQERVIAKIRRVVLAG